MNTRTTHPLADLFPKMGGDEFELLKRDIAEKGILEAILLAPDGSIIDGRHRYKAGIELGYKDDQFEFNQLPEGTGDQELVAIALSLNLHRRHLTQSQKAMVAARVRPLFEDVLGDAATAHKVEGEAAKALKVGYTLVNKATKLQEESNACQELLDSVDDGWITVLDALSVANETEKRQLETLEAYKEGRARSLKQALKKLQRDDKIRLVEAAEPVVGEYNVIVADPPWQYEKRLGDESQMGKTPYPTMTGDQMKAYSMPAAKDCILWLWTTNAHFPLAYELIAHWGFSPKTVLTWAKPRIGNGDWLRGQTEHCIFAVKGKPVTRPPGNTSTLLAAPKGEHSEKPEAFFELVEHLCPGSKVELFARRKRAGWDAFGAEL